MARKISFEEARRRYVNRYTMEHIPAWAVGILRTILLI